MLKSKNTKHKQSSGLYQVNKKGSGAEDKGTKEAQQDNNEFQCDVCSDTAERLIQCERCLKWHCLKCSKISDSVMNVLDENEALHWFCGMCNATALKAIQTFSQEGCAAKDQSIENRLLSMEKQLGDVVSSINKLSVNSNLPTYSVAAKTATAPDHTPSNQFALKIVDEYRDREKRKLNLIFHKIPESPSTDSTKRWEDDKSLH